MHTHYFFSINVTRSETRPRYFSSVRILSSRVVGKDILFIRFRYKNSTGTEVRHFRSYVSLRHPPPTRQLIPLEEQTVQNLLQRSEMRNDDTESSFSAERRMKCQPLLIVDVKLK